MGPIQPISRVEPTSVHLIDATGDKHGHTRQFPRQPHQEPEPEVAPGEEADQPKALSLDISV